MKRSVYLLAKYLEILAHVGLQKVHEDLHHEKKLCMDFKSVCTKMHSPLPSSFSTEFLRFPPTSAGKVPEKTQNTQNLHKEGPKVSVPGL